MTWALWVIGGILLLGLELITPGGFFLFFFGLAGIIVGALVAVGLGGPTWLQWLVFALLAVLSLTLFRKKLLQMIGPKSGKKVDSLVGDLGTALEEIAPNSTAKAEVRGTAWSAKNVGTTPIAKGQRLEVQALDGLTVMVKGVE